VTVGWTSKGEEEGRGKGVTVGWTSKGEEEGRGRGVTVGWTSKGLERNMTKWRDVQKLNKVRDFPLKCQGALHYIFTYRCVTIDGVWIG
jgi:hypothetical protein